jgi:hypothetical protein
MDTTTILAIIVVILLAVMAAGIAWYLAEQRRRSRRLRDRFGPEYARAVRDSGDRRRAEDDLEARAARVDGLRIRPLAPDERDRFDAAWRGVQSRFVDEPRAAVTDADALVGRVMDARGYPVAKFEQRAADVSVDHPQVVDHYRVAHRIAIEAGPDDADTEQLRQAMVHYRALFADLLDSGAAEHDRTTEPVAERATDRAGEPAVAAAASTDAEPASPGRRP